MHVRRWIIAAGILGAVSLALLIAIAAISHSWLPVLATGAILAGTGSCAAVAVARAQRRRAHRAGMDLVMGHVRQIMAGVPSP